MTNYNLSNLTSSNNIVEYAQAANALTGDVYFTFVNAMIFLIAFVALKNYDTQSAFMSASFLSAATAGVLWSVGLLAESALLVFFVLFVVSIAVSFFSR